ncbi:MAG: hypothetical protein ACRELY_09700, partial [Polyangiaceae bacterium]
GSGSGANGEGGIAGSAELATFPNFVPSGLTTSGDIAIVTLSSLSAGTAGEVVQVTSGGTVTVLVGDAGVPTLPAVGSNTLFYFDAPNGGTRSVMRLDLSDVSSGPQDIFDGVEEPGGMLVNGGNLVISSNAGGTGVEVDNLPITGGASTSITSVSGAFSPGAVAVDNANVYFVAAATGAGEIAASPLTGAVADPIVAGTAGNLGPLVFANSTVYFTVTANPNGSIESIPTLGGAPTTLLGGLFDPSSLVVADGYVYFTTNNESGGISRVLLNDDAGVGAEVLATATNPGVLALGTSSIYAITADGLIRLPR